MTDPSAYFPSLPGLLVMCGRSALYRMGTYEAQQEPEHNGDKGTGDDGADASKPLLQKNVESATEDASNGACATGSCDKQYWSCPGNAGFKAWLMLLSAPPSGTGGGLTSSEKLPGALIRCSLQSCLCSVSQTSCNVAGVPASA